MKKILVPVDFSDASLNALSYAIQLFKGQPLEVTILHTYNLMGSSAFTMKMNSIKRVMKEDAEKAMNGLLKKMEIEEPDVTFNSKIINNNATSTITLMGDSGIYDCIVMGTKGASGLKEVFIGSVAGWVISKTKAPVIIVPKALAIAPYSKWCSQLVTIH
jgi:nucleotide-binding universal stress UspA family protein